MLHGRVGKKIVNHYSFYAAFATIEEFRIVARGKTLGTLPFMMMLKEGQRIFFAGRTWLIEDVDEGKKVIFVQRASGGAPPTFTGGRGRVHTRVRQRMYELLLSDYMPSYLDNVASKFLSQARSFFIKKDMKDAAYIDHGGQLTLLTWLGDNGNEALICLLASQGINDTPSGPAIEIQKSGSSSQYVISILLEARRNELPSVDELLADATNIKRAK